MPDQSKQPNRFTEFPHISHEHLQIMMKCMSICASCAKMCINEGHKKTAVLCNECADVCALAIKLHSGDSEFNPDIMNLCSKVCARCAEECGEMDAEHCQQCSQICQECSESCANE
ncbi:MAG: four-helix bundle copper-binding protein [Chlamydiales bacterium]|nr:four-helix bundle copper-binding protein [Chlamydiales bacterium]